MEQNVQFVKYMSKATKLLEDIINASDDARRRAAKQRYEDHHRLVFNALFLTATVEQETSLERG